MCVDLSVLPACLSVCLSAGKNEQKLDENVGQMQRMLFFRKEQCVRQLGEGVNERVRECERERDGVRERERERGVCVSVEKESRCGDCREWKTREGKKRREREREGRGKKNPPCRTVGAAQGGRAARVPDFISFSILSASLWCSSFS